MKTHQKFLRLVSHVFVAIFAMNGSACSPTVPTKNKAPKIEFEIKKQSLDHGPIRMRLLPIDSSGEIAVLAGEIWIHCPGYGVARNFSEGRHALIDGCIVEIGSGASCKIIVGKKTEEVMVPVNSSNVWLKFVASEQP